VACFGFVLIPWQSALRGARRVRSRPRRWRVGMIFTPSFCIALLPIATSASLVCLWDGLERGETWEGAELTGMNVRSDDSRIGAGNQCMPTVTISAASANSDAPCTADDCRCVGRIPPMRMTWKGKTSAEICVSCVTRRNGAFQARELSDTSGTSAFVRGVRPRAHGRWPPGLNPERGALQFGVAGGHPVSATK